MAKSGGDIIEVTFNHPTIGSGVFYPKSSESSTYDIGGVRTRDDENAIDGSGDPIWTMNRVRGGFEFVIANDMNNAKDIEKLAELHASPVPATWKFTIINGVSYGGSGKPVGDLKGDVDKATVNVKIAGSQFKQI